MSTTTANGTDAVKGGLTGTSKQHLQQLRGNPSVNGASNSIGGSSNGRTSEATQSKTGSPVDGYSRKPQSPSSQLRAWHGPNPITARASTVTPNGTEKSHAKPIPQQSSAKIAPDANMEKHAHDRMLFLLANFTGQDATITLKSGEQFTGIFSGGSFEASSKHQYILKMCKRIRPATHQQVNGTTEQTNDSVGDGEDHMMVFDKEDTVDLAVVDVNLAFSQPQTNGSANSSFRTDTEISGRDPQLPRERELQRWDAGADSIVDLSLGDTTETGWDQFATNERMYGVQSTYDESIYTTEINRKDPLYKQREAEAERIAREIEGSTATSSHVAEERRKDAARDDGLDEEEKYSGVLREEQVLPKRAAGAYIPPSQRPTTNTPTVPGAPYDPAIISSQLAKPQPSSAIITTAQSDAKDEQKTGRIDSDLSEHKATVPPPVLVQKSTTEDHVRNVTDSFKQFANNEKLKIRQAQEAKRSTQRAEKNVKLNDLKKFAANFKLKSRVPDDLVPILAKDRVKQLEIQKKAEDAASEEAAIAKEREKEKAIAAAAGAPTTAAAAAVTGAATGSSTAAGAAQPDQRPSAFNQHARSRLSQNLRVPLPGQITSPRQVQGQRGPLPAFGRLQLQSPPESMKFHRPSGSKVESGPLSPASATKLNVKAPAFEFRPGANAFTPTGTSPSPQRSSEQSVASVSANFFDKNPAESTSLKDVESSFSAINALAKGDHAEEQKKTFASNGGVPQPYRTPPVWPHSDSNVNVSYKDFIPKSQIHSQNQSPMHTPNPNMQLPHAHQLPPQLQGPQVSTPSQRPQYVAGPHHPQHQQGFDPRMQGQFGPNGSLQSSPRFPHAQMAYNSPMPAGMPMQQFTGQQMPQYGMSPGMQYRQMNMPNVQPNGPMMIIGQPHGQQMAPIPQGVYPRGVQFNPQMMNGIPMAAQPSGNFMNGPIPQNQGYSPMPPPAQPHMAPHLQNSGYGAGSPRPHMMQHSGSHQGFNPHMQPTFAPSPSQGPHPFHMQQRQMSSNSVYGQMTPRQQQVLPSHPSPGMGGPHGDEGK